MHDVFAEADSVQLFVHNDDDTPLQFVRDLLRAVFGKSEREAIAFTALVEGQHKVGCGPYPAPVAKALLESARQHIRAAGHCLLITSEAVKVSGPCGTLRHTYTLDRNPARAQDGLHLCDDCILYAVRHASEEMPAEKFTYVCTALDWHFSGIPQSQLVTRAREFPGHMRVDVQVAVDQLFASPIHFFGVHEEHRYETLAFTALMKDGRNAPTIVPPLYHDVDIGEMEPVKCLHNGLWLCRQGEFRYAVLLSFHREYRNEAAIRIEIAVPTGTTGDAFVQRCFVELEKAVHTARSYRGKILSLDGGADYRGRSRGVTVHRLPAVDRGQEVILPERTLKLLDRNVLDFVGKPRGAAPPRAIDPQGHSALWPAGHRPRTHHHPLPRDQFARAHDADLSPPSRSRCWTPI